MSAGLASVTSEVAAALEVLRGAGFSLTPPERPFRTLSISQAAERLGCSQDWIRDNLSEFRGAFRVGRLVRLPEDDLERFAARRRIFRGRAEG